jgi:hypothetical protein
MGSIEMRMSSRAAVHALVLVIACAIAGCKGGGESNSPSPVPSQPGSNAGANAAPTIQGQAPTSIVAGQQYVFQPTASDPDGDTLAFSANNLPSGASLNSTTGRLTWTPRSDQVGTYSNIALSVTDGRSTVSLAAFAITVSDVATGSATLSWTAPTQNTDGSALTNLAGYEIHYGRNASSLDRLVRLDTPGLTTYMIENLSTGTWYFAIAARNSQGVASSLSSVASKVIS